MTQPTHTPGKKPFTVPTQALAEAIKAEWHAHKKFSPHAMPLTTLAYTAIDRVTGQKDNIIEVLLAYIDTDTLCYRAGVPGVFKRQKQEWDPVIAWADKAFGGTWDVTTGIMPLMQPPELQANVRAYLASLSDMQLAAACVLASGYSSLILALAVLKKHIDAEQAFALSRVEEDAQAEQWGRDEEAENRTRLMKAEITPVGQFLRLLEAA